MSRLNKILLLLLFAAAASSAAAQRYDRGFERNSSAFIEKGTWMVGGTVAYSTHRNDNYRFFIIEGINSNGYRFSLSPVFCYMVRDNMGVGMRFSYGRNLLKVDSASVSIDQTQINVKDYYTLSHDYSMIAIYRNYIPLGDSKRFALYNEMSLAGGGSQARFANDSPVKGTYQKGYSFSLGISPGIIAFATNNMAVEVNVGVMGITYDHTEQVHNQVTVGERNISQMNFKINIFSIGLGVAFYL